MAARSVTVGQIGCGYWGPNLLRNLAARRDVRVKLVDQGANELVGSTPEELAKLIRSEIDKYRALVKKALQSING